MENFSRRDINKAPETNDPKVKMLYDLDKFIQDSLDKYKPKENPDESLYANTTEEQKDLIISKKSTIPDLVIWNKLFNKNECFVGADTNKKNDFPRFTFYLRLNKDKNGKNKSNKNKEKKNKKNKKNKKKENNKDDEDTKEAFGNNNIMNNDDNDMVDDIKNDVNKMNLNEDNMNINMNMNNRENKKEKKKKNNKQKMPKMNNNNEPQNKFNDFNPPII